MSPPPRARAQALAAGRGGQHTLAVPLALRLAARIQERPLDDFFEDPTQLANGLRDFLDAVRPDGLVVTDGEALRDEVANMPVERLRDGMRIGTALEAAGRLRETVGDSAVLVAVLPGPATIAESRDKGEAGEVVQTLAQEFVGVGVDIILFTESEGTNLADFEAPLRTSANVARFHRGLTCLRGATLPFLTSPTVLPVTEPRPASGLVITDTDLPPDTDVTLVQDWVALVGS